MATQYKIRFRIIAIAPYEFYDVKEWENHVYKLRKYVSILERTQFEFMG